MKISNNTLAILKNFAKVNSGLVIKPGDFQRTISPENKDVLVEAKLEDSFPSEFGIYNLDQFLGNLTSLNYPELTFSENFVELNDGEVKMHFYACPSNLIVTPRDESLPLDDIVAKFVLTKEIQRKLINLADKNDFNNFTVIGKNNALSLKVHEKGNDTSNFALMEGIGSTAGDDFEYSFSIKNLHLLMDDRDYKVELQSEAFARFASVDGKLVYFIAMENL